MNTDIRLNTGFYRNLKTLKLQKRLGFAGIISLQKLWLWTAENCPNGILDGVDTECLALLAEWDGDENEFVDTLLDLKWLEKDQNGCYFLHDWEERNPWASDADSRADKARFSRLAQVAPNAYRELASSGIDRVTKDEYQQILSESQNAQRRKSGETLAKRQRNASETPANAEQNAGETLAPSPDPSPTPKPRRFSEEGEISDPKEDPPPNPPPVTGGGGERDGFPLPTQSKRKQPKPEPPEFAEFYASYPRKVARSTALKAWLRIRPDPTDVMEGLARWIRVWDSRGEEGRRFIPYPATFLNQERWKECEESDGRRGRSITEHWDSKTGGGWKPSNHWGENVPTDEELDNILEQTFGDMRNAPIQPGAGHI